MAEYDFSHSIPNFTIGYSYSITYSLFPRISFIPFHPRFTSLRSPQNSSHCLMELGTAYGVAKPRGSFFFAILQNFARSECCASFHDYFLKRGVRFGCRCGRATKWLRRNCSRSFMQSDKLIDRDVLVHFNEAQWPTDFDVDGSSCAQSEVKARVIGRDITRLAHCLLYLDLLSAANHHPGSKSAAVTLCSAKANLDPVVL